MRRPTPSADVAEHQRGVLEGRVGAGRAERPGRGAHDLAALVARDLERPARPRVRAHVHLEEGAQRLGAMRPLRHDLREHRVVDEGQREHVGDARKVGGARRFDGDHG